MRILGAPLVGRKPRVGNNLTQQAVSSVASVPPPVLGWNARDSLADMDQGYAVTLINVFPGTSDVGVRPGYVDYTTGVTGAVETLLEYQPPTGNGKLFLAANNAFYEAVLGAVGAAVSTGHTSNRWQHTMFGTAGGSFLVAVNGVDAPRNYNGTAWAATPAITGTGLTASNLITVTAHKQRLFFGEKGTLKFWYLPVNTLGGAALAFDLASLCNKGGELQAIGSWSVDSGAGQDDLFVAITTRGEVIVYSGLDPGVATDWNLVGIYDIGYPIGRRCMLKLGPDLIVITQDGFFPLSRAIGSARTQKQAALSDKISNAVNDAVRMHGTKFGWQPVHYPRGTLGLFNVPTQEGVQSRQYVVNTITGAWCEFRGINAGCWAVFNDRLYFGKAGVVCLFDDTASDNNSAINSDMKTAFTALNSRSSLKRFTMVRPIFLSDGPVSPLLGVNIDYNDTPPPGAVQLTLSGGAIWDVSDWDVSDWGGTEQLFRDWQSVEGVGYFVSFRCLLSTKGATVRLRSIDYMSEPGGYL